MREKLPRISQARALPGLRLALTFEDGVQSVVALEGFIADFPSLRSLRDGALFSSVRIEEWGSGVTWDNEGPLSIAATTLRRLAAEQSDDPARRFDAWMQRNGLSLASAAETLGMTRRMVSLYRTGSRPIPKIVQLACAGWEAQRKNK